MTNITRQDKKNTNWSKVSDSSLVNAYRYRKKNDIEISNELNAELAKRFNNYDIESQKFQKKKTDWSKSSNASLMTAYHYRKKLNMQISDDLNEEMAKRFPNYDPNTKTFKQKTDWSKSSRESILVTYHYRKRNNIPISNELNIELAKRFPNYDPVTKTLNVKIDWSKSSDQSLKTSYYYRKKNNIQIPDELNKELTKRFNNYDPDTRTIKQKNDWSKSSRDSVLVTFHFRKRNHLPISDELNQELAKRFPNYDPVTQTLKKITKKKKISEYSKLTLHVTYYKYKRQNLPISDEFNEEMAKRFPNYDPINRSFKKTTNETTDSINEDQKATIQTKTQYKKHIIWSETTDNKLRSAYQYRKKNKILIPDDLNEELAKRFPGYDPEKQIFDKLEQTRQEEAYAEKLRKIVTNSRSKKIVVSVQTVDTKEDVTYNDVFVNGTKILSNHINTQIKLLCDDTILAIHGIITNDARYPNNPTWLAYNAQMQSIPPIKTNIYSGHYVQIKHISYINTKVNVFLDNKTTIILNKEKMKKIANGRYFVLNKDNSR